MRTIKLTIGFDGTRYEGWQSQRKDSLTDSGRCRTLQETFEKILSKIFKVHTPIISSSRTDSGVHAVGLVAHFRTASKLADTKIKDALNFYLPPDVVVFKAETAPSHFHARFSAKRKVYRYRIWNHPTRPLFEAPTVLWHPQPLSVALMNESAKYFKGRHDFSAFRDSGDDERNPVRTIYGVKVSKEKELIEIEVQGSGFLRHMVRIIAGTLIQVGRKKVLPKEIPTMIHSKDRKKSGPTAKPQGLTLVKVKY